MSGKFSFSLTFPYAIMDGRERLYKWGVCPSAHDRWQQLVIEHRVKAGQTLWHGGNCDSDA